MTDTIVTLAALLRSAYACNDQRSAEEIIEALEARIEPADLLSLVELLMAERLHVAGAAPEANLSSPVAQR